jgi:hypothetical protein
MSPVDWIVLFVCFVLAIIAERLISVGRIVGSKFLSDNNWLMGLVAAVCFIIAAFLYVGVVNELIAHFHYPEFLTFMAVAFDMYLIQVTIETILKRRAKVV